MYKIGKMFKKKEKRGMERLNISLLGVCGPRWKSKKYFISNDHRIIYRGEEMKEELD